jgi:hypothetical protein
VHVKSTFPAGCSIVMVIFVSVSCGFTPVHLSLLQPACVPDTVAGAVKTAGSVVNVTFPFLIWSAGMVVGVVVGPTRTLFWPAGSFCPLGFWHW